ncbi:endonuclease/exonuclease/phosphatase family protein [Streptosporangium saharense]|uniref:Endonuclease/exonuclease/phosphatase family metal-dependent hydrolase n=1 Tax=Streptosporangium saharense TaxID=1706840 RepID=A0A7W7VQZ7_9ACTN|nr:endonuclease/exonuclease/phosphatase family protein [Streptosporangium saharense]MBB4919258.1 endonuclease/exonuclease/phosphatase family metal-dependent hydrolase [Streptosporangium saharense]
MRVVTFNLCNGGIDNGNDTRLRRQLDRLAGLDADVIALQEAKHWAEPNTRLFHGGQPFHLAKRTLGMDGFLVPSEHDGCHLALFVRTGRVQVLQEKHTVGAPYWHAVGHLRALVDGRVTSFVNVHSAPSTPRLREIEAESLALKVRKGEPVIMMGDWNAVPTTYAGTSGDRRKLDHQAAFALSEVGLRDAAVAMGVTIPTVTTPLPYPCDRIYFKGLTPTSFQIGTGNWASDHLPAIGDFDLTPPEPVAI